jgi:uncharacterized RDD family membrane protein YckC
MASASAGVSSNPALEIPPAALEPLAPIAQPAAELASAEKTVPPPARPRPLSVVSSGAAPAAAADRSYAPAPRPLREAPPRADRSAPPRPRGEPGGLGARVLAGVLDLGAVALAQGLLLAPAAYYWWSRDLSAQVPFAPIALTLALVVLTASLGALYFIYFWGARGATPGKQLVGLVVEGTDGSFPIGVPRAATRLLGYLLSAALLGGGFLLIALDGKGLHDRIAGTRVVKRRE